MDDPEREGFIREPDRRTPADWLLLLAALDPLVAFGVAASLHFIYGRCYARPFCGWTRVV